MRAQTTRRPPARACGAHRRRPGSVADGCERCCRRALRVSCRFATVIACFRLRRYVTVRPRDRALPQRDDAPSERRRSGGGTRWVVGAHEERATRVGTLRNTEDPHRVRQPARAIFARQRPTASRLPRADDRDGVHTRGRARTTRVRGGVAGGGRQGVTVGASSTAGFTRNTSAWSAVNASGSTVPSAPR